MNRGRAVRITLLSTLLLAAGTAAWTLRPDGSIEPHRLPIPTERDSPDLVVAASGPIASGISSFPYVDLEEATTRPSSQPTSIRTPPALTEEDLKPLVKYLELFSDLEEDEGAVRWDPKEHGRIPAQFTLFEIANADLADALKFYRAQILEHVGVTEDELVGDPSLQSDLKILIDSWLISASLHRRLEALSSRLKRMSRVDNSDRAALESRRNELVGAISTVIGGIADISLKYYTRYSQPRK